MREYKVYLTGYNGMDKKDIPNKKPYAVCNTLEEALKECEKAWKEELYPDEAAYIYDGKDLKEDYEWK